MLFTRASDARQFALAGRAVLTIKSQATGEHLTYRLREARQRHPSDPPAWFVALRTMKPRSDEVVDVEEDETSPGLWAYLGLLTQNGDQFRFSLTQKSQRGEKDVEVRAFVWFLRHVLAHGRIPPTLEVRHEGKCGRCGRPLTTPESIDRGIGPECWSKLTGD